MAEYTLRIRRYEPETGRRPTGRTTRSTSRATAACSTASSRPRTARTARSASAAPARRRSAAPAACGSTGRRSWPATPSCSDAVERGDDGAIVVEPMGNMPVLKDLIVNMDAVHWKKVQRVVPWLLPEGDSARARVRRAARVDDRRHAVDGVHPLRRLRIGLPVAGGRPAVHRARGAREGLPLRRRPARRPDRGAAARPRRGPARDLRLHALLQLHRGVPEGRRPDGPDHAAAPHAPSHDYEHQRPEQRRAATRRRSRRSSARRASSTSASSCRTASARCARRAASRC